MDFLRAGDILIDRLKTGKSMPTKEMLLIETYALRIQSLVRVLDGYDKIASSVKRTFDVAR